MSNQKFRLNRARLVLFLVILLVSASVVIITLNPASRTGPFGIGIPADMERFELSQLHFSINYPQSWVANETPGGNHGDAEIVATILVPGRSFPHAYFAMRDFSEGGIEQVINWGEQRGKKYNNYSEMEMGEYRTPKGYFGWYRNYSWITRSVFKEYIIRCSDYYFMENNKGISISFCANEDDWNRVLPTFRSMIDSIEWTNK